MKILLSFIIVIGLVGCGQNPVVEQPTAAPVVVTPPVDLDPGEIQEITGYYNGVDPMTNDDLELGQGIVINNFARRQLISSPLTISGVAPRSWYFEGSFPITLMTLEDDVVKAWYASGPWLELLPGTTEMQGTDSIPFTATIEFETPDDVDMGKIRFAKNLVADEDVEVFVETMILWP